MKVVLINPPAYHTIEVHDTPNHPQLGLAYLAGSLEKNNIPVKIIDAKFECLNVNQVIEKLKAMDFDIVGFTSMTHDILVAVEVAKKIKEGFKDKVIIIGGVHATALPKETLKEFSCFDYAAVGECEVEFPKLIDALREKKPLEGINGFYYRKDNEIKQTGLPAIVQDLDELPFPAWHLSPKAKEYHILTARGCPYQCVFCMSPYGRTIRERSPENVLKEIELVIARYNPEVYRLTDETFGFNRERAIKILDMIIEKGFHKVKKVASMRANKTDLELVKKMKQAGFDYIEVGVETGNAEMMKRIKKGITLEQAEAAVKAVKEAGITVGVGFILGHPNETRETIKDTINFAIKLNADVTAIGVMVPYPGTEVAEMIEKGEGGYKQISTNWLDFNKQLGNALELKNISRRELERYQAQAYLKIYLYNHRYLDLMKFIWTYRKAGFKLLKKMFKK